MSTERKLRDFITRRLLKGAAGSLEEWRAACDAARMAGWSEERINAVLTEVSTRGVQSAFSDHKAKG